MKTVDKEFSRFGHEFDTCNNVLCCNRRVTSISVRRDLAQQAANVRVQQNGSSGTLPPMFIGKPVCISTNYMPLP